MEMNVVIRSAELKTTKTGKPYWSVMLMSGEKLSAWQDRDGLICQQNIGKTVKLECSEKITATGTYHNIERVSPVNAEEEFKQSLEIQTQKGLDKDSAIARAVALKAATEILCRDQASTPEMVLAQAEIYLAWLLGQESSPDDQNPL